MMKETERAVIRIQRWISVDGVFGYSHTVVRGVDSSRECKAIVQLVHCGWTVK